MRHFCEACSELMAVGDIMAAVAERQAAEQRMMQQSNEMPYRAVAYVFAAAYCSVLAVVAALVKLCTRVAPSIVDRKLAEVYYYVPEMALHKSIEMEAFLRYDYRGRGLDLGCGNGLVGGILIEAAGVADLHGVDLNEACRESVLENGYASFTKADIQALTFPDESFDYAVSICVIEHVPDLTRAVAEIGRVLKLSGQFVFTTPAPNFRGSTLGYRFFTMCGLHKRAEEFKRKKDLSSMQFHYLSPEDWQKKLEKAGFGDITIAGIFSRRQLLIYDLMNIQVNWMRFYFADKLASTLIRHPLLRRIMIAVTTILSAHFGRVRPINDETATHYLVACVKNPKPRTV